MKKQKGVFNMQITKDTVIGNILDEAPDTAPFFLEMGMHCLGCPASRGETVEMACMVHGVNADELIAKINKFLAEK
jgi:hybrid cluster-associated redox disulfide protein